jgi:hypothetical protein
MTTPRAVALLVVLAAPLGAASSSPGGAKPARKVPAAAAPAAAPADLQISVTDVADRRRSADFPPARLSLSLKLEGADAAVVQAARARVAIAQDDTGADLLDNTGVDADADRWQEAREGQPPVPQLVLKSPARKARVVAALEGTLEAYMPARDPSAVVKIPRIAAQTDKPAAPVPALAKHRIRLQVLSKAGLEKERKAAEARAKAAPAKKTKAKPGVEGAADAMAEAMAGAIGGIFERLFMMAGDHDLILKVEDPEKAVFSFGVTGPDGAPVQTFGTTEIEGYRIVRVFEALPDAAVLEVRLKTPRSFAQVPFKLTDIRLP